MRGALLLGCTLAVACGGSRPPAETGGGAGVAPPAREVPPGILALPGYREARLPDPVFGGEVHVLEAGPEDAPAMVLVHGLGARASADWFAVLPALARSHRVIALDLPGFGQSTGGNQLYSPERYVEVVERVVGRRVASPFVLVGHSMGAAVSLLYAATHPERVERLVLIDTAGILHRDTYTGFLVHTQLDGVLASAATTLMAPFAARSPEPALFLEHEATRSAVLGGDPTRIAALALLVHEFGPALDAVRAPTLLLWGEADEVAPLRTGHLLESRLSRARLEVLPDGGHVPISESPAWVTERILGWLAAEPPLPAVPAPPGDRTGRCDGQADQVFEGAYDRIEATRCRRLVLRHVTARQVVLRDTVAELTDVRLVRDSGEALVLEESVIRMTGGSLRAPVCVKLAGSELDAAGTVLDCGEAAFAAEDTSKLILSAVRSRSPLTRAHLHEVRVLPSGERF